MVVSTGGSVRQSRNASPQITVGITMATPVPTATPRGEIPLSMALTCDPGSGCKHEHRNCEVRAKDSSQETIFRIQVQQGGRKNPDG